jgi:hypothetical protein
MCQGRRLEALIEQLGMDEFIELRWKIVDKNGDYLLKSGKYSELEEFHAGGMYDDK